MEIRKTEFPVTLQAFEVRDTREEFLAEQVVHTQAEADRFTSRFNGKLIKAHALRPDEVKRADRYHPTERRSGFPAWAVFLIVLIALLVAAYFLGWLGPVIDRVK